MQGIRRTGRASFAALLLIGAVSMAACGPGPAGTASGGSGESSGSAKLGTIKVITSVPQGIPYIGVNKGNELGAWEGSGLNVDVIPGSSPSVVTAVASG